MGRKPKSTEPPEGDGLPEQAESPAEHVRREFAEQRQAKKQWDIEELLDQCANQEGQVTFRKIDLITTAEKHLERVPIESIESDIHEFVRARYGGGKFRAIFYRRGEDDRFYQMTTRIIEIDANIPPGTFFKSMEKAPEKEGVNSLVETILGKIQDKNAGDISVSQMMLLMHQQAQENSKQMMSMMTALISTLGKGAGGGNSQGMDLLTALGVFDKLKGSSDTIKPTIELLEFTRKVMMDRVKKDDENSPWAEMIGQALSVVLAKMGAPPNQLVPEKQATAGPPPSLPEPEKTGNPFATATTAEPTQPQTEEDAMLFVRSLPIKTLAGAILPKLLKSIEEDGAQPEDALEMFNNPLSPAQLSDKQYADLVAILKTDTWAADLFGDEKKLGEHRAWFEELRRLALEQASEEEKESQGDASKTK